MNSCYKAGLIRVITLPDAEAAGIHGRLIMEMFPNMTVETKCIPDQSDGLHSVESKNAAIPKIIEVAQSFKDIDVLIVSCADDPAVPELKKYRKRTGHRGRQQRSRHSAAVRHQGGYTWNNRLCAAAISGDTRR